MRLSFLFAILMVSACSFSIHRPASETCNMTMDAVCVYSSHCSDISYDACKDTHEQLKVKQACNQLTYIEEINAYECHRQLLHNVAVQKCEWPLICDQIKTY